MATGQPGPDPLLEREHELEHAEAMLAAALAGEGTVLLVEGRAGMGKTRLAQAVAEAAASKGFAVHWATGDQLERGFAFGVLRDLLASMLHGRDGADHDVVFHGPAGAAVRRLESADPDLPEGVDADALTVDYGFYRLLHDLAERCPRLVCVDDAHWADLRSLHALRFAARRSGELPVVIVLTHRPSQDPDLTGLLGRLAAPPNGARLVLSPLGARSVSLLAASVLSNKTDEALGRQLSTITGGNPFLVREMLAAVRVGSLGSQPADIADLERLVPASIVESVRRRMTVAGDDARSFADALAVLGEASLRDVAGLATLDEAAAVIAADRLAAAGVVSTGPPVRFAHPILRQAVRTQIPAASLSLVHARAARLLSEVGAPLESVAAHLLEALPRGDPWAVTTLMAAARHEQRQGSPDTAVPLLARAAAEPPPPGQRFDTTLALAEAQAQTHHPEAAATARQAVDLAAGPQQLATARLQLVRTLGLLGDFHAALDLLDDPRPTGTIRIRT
ncbi:MAG: AAA family ATPase [Actinobacteria bacterium]|nr:AAA family ATPase [Actinomycetota bacterium]